MFNSPNHALAIALFITGTIAPVARSDSTVQLAISGFHIATDPVQEGEDWWGIFPAEGGYELQPTRITVEAVPDPLDGDDTVKSATMIHLPNDAQGIVLLRGLKATAGALKALDRSRFRGTLQPNTSFELPALPGDPNGALRISAFGTTFSNTTDDRSTIQFQNYELQLSSTQTNNSTRQVLASFLDIERDFAPRLRWAGDLDRDGKLDLLYDLSTDEVSTDLALFLSTAACEGQIVGLVARWRAAGSC